MLTLFATCAATTIQADGFRYTLIKEQSECNSNDLWLGKRSLKSCAEECARRRDCRFFIHGKEGTKLDDCYVEYTVGRKCPEGWEEDAFDFWEIGADDEEANGAKPKLVLVDQNDPRRLALANASAVRSGQQAPLALAAPHNGYAICRDFAERREAFGEWEYTALAVGPAAEAVTCALSGGRLVEGASQGVVTPSMLQLHEGNHYDFVWHKHNHPARLHEEAAGHGAPLDLVIHADGSVAPTQASHLRLGLEFEVPRLEKAEKANGRWEVYRNIDMAYQGDVEIIGDWKRHTSIDKLKKIVEEKGYSAVVVGSFGHAALKSFDYQLTKEHCKPSEGYTNEIHIWFPSGEAAKPPKVEVPDCTLVMAHAAECVKLLPEVAQALRAGRTTPLLLASHPGYAIVPKSDEPQRIDDWGVNYQQLGIGPASEALQAKMHGEFLLSQHPATRDYVLDVPFATYAVHCEGEHGKLPLAVISWDDRSRNLDADAPRTFVVNADNSISPTKATHLAFGIRGVLPAVGAQMAELKMQAGGKPAVEDADLDLGSTPSHGNPRSTNDLNSELNNVARNTDDTAKARALVKAGADLRSTNGPPWRHTPLHQAAFHGRYKMAKTLVELGAPLDLHSNPVGRGATGTPLELARGGGHHKIADMLEKAAGGKQHAAKTEGRWEVYRNIDMAYQGDVEIIGDWKRHTSIDKLKKIVEEKGYSAVVVGSFGHAALKSFDYQLTKEHCKPSEGYTNEIHIWFPSGEAAKPPKVEVPDCTLVMAHAAECVKLLPEVAQALRAGRTTPLLLASHPGYAIVPKSDEPQRIDDWGVNYQQLGIGPASEALQAKMHGEFLLSQHPATRDYVLDVPFATYAVHCEGEHGKLPLAVISWDDRSRNLDADAPRTFVVNADNSISPTKATHLAFGIRGVLPAVVAEARVGVTSTVPQTYAHADRTITHRKPGPRLTYADSEAYAAKMGGRLLTLDEAKALMGGRALYPGEDQWCAVQGRDWVQVGDLHHHPGKSHNRECGGYPPWGDDANNSRYGNPSWNYVALYKIQQNREDVEEFE